MKMNLKEAIVSRHSVRAFTGKPLEQDVATMLEERIETINKEANLHIQLVRNEPKAFKGGLAKYGKFANVNDYILMAGGKSSDLDERIGYYGEMIVLLAQTLGLNSCWVGLTYKKTEGAYVLNEGETIRACIAIGYGKEGGRTHKTKTAEEVSDVCEQSPSWYRKGVEAALLAPTAVNQQKFFFEYIPASEGGKAGVRATRRFSLVGFTKIDLGIAKCHFEIGAGKENFEWR